MCCDQRRSKNKILTQALCLLLDRYYGSGADFVDTSKVFTVVTQFLTDDSGTLSEIKRFYVQDGKTIGNAESNLSGVSGNSITPDYCTAQKTATNNTDYFLTKGGWESVTDAMSSGMVLVMSLWDDVSIILLLLLSIIFDH